MRGAMFAATLGGLATIAVALAGCTAGGFGGGKMVAQKMEAADFTAVDISGPFDAVITQSDTFGVTVTVREDFLDYVLVTKAGNTLNVSLDPRHPFTDFSFQSSAFKVDIAMPALERIALSGATKARLIGFKSARDFTAEVSGASSVNMENIEAGNVGWQLSGASRVNGSLKATALDVTVSGASKIDLAGSGDSLLLVASGASNVDLLDFLLGQADVRLSGASEADLDVKTKLDLSLTGASRLYFQGNPAIGNMSITGASTVKHK